MRHTYRCTVHRRTPFEALDAWDVVIAISPAEAATNTPMSYEAIEAYLYDVPEPRVGDKPWGYNLAHLVDLDILGELADLAYEQYATDDERDLPDLYDPPHVPHEGYIHPPRVHPVFEGALSVMRGSRAADIAAGRDD